MSLLKWISFRLCIVAISASQLRGAEPECVICLDGYPEIQFSPCGHAVICSRKSCQLRKRECPTCRAPIRKQKRLIGSATRAEEAKQENNKQTAKRKAVDRKINLFANPNIAKRVALSVLLMVMSLYCSGHQKETCILYHSF